MTIPVLISTGDARQDFADCLSPVLRAIWKLAKVRFTAEAQRTQRFRRVLTIRSWRLLRGLGVNL